MDPASRELERRSRYLSSLVRRTTLADPPVQEPEPAVESSGGEGKGGKLEIKDREAEAKGEARKVAVRVLAAHMPLTLQRRAIRVARDAILGMPRLDSKRLALALKKEFDTTYGPAWHCIVGTSFGSYVTHSSVGFLSSRSARHIFFSSERLSSH